MSLFSILAIACGFGAAGAWFVAAISAVFLMAHRAEGVSVGYLLTHGLAFFDEKNFTEAGRPLRARFLGAFVAFMAFLVGGAVAGALASR